MIIYIIIIVFLVFIIVLLFLNLTLKKNRKEKTLSENQDLSIKRKKRHRETLLLKKEKNTVDENQIIKIQLLNKVIQEYQWSEKKYSCVEIIDYLENDFNNTIREFDDFIQKNIKEIRTQDHEHYFQFPNESLADLESKKQILNKNIDNLIKMILSLNNEKINLACYLFVNKVSEIMNHQNKFFGETHYYSVIYFNYTGEITVEYNYLKRKLKTKHNTV